VGGTTAQTQSGASLADDSPPQKGGTFRIVSSGDIRGLDPGSAEGSEDWWSAGWVLYNFLYFYDKDNKLYPDVAADYPKISADGTTYTIPLRKGVKFHNGRELKAADAKFSLEWQIWPEVYSWGKNYGENIVGYKDVFDGKTKELSGVKVIDDYTIQVQLDKPQAVFPGLLSYTMWGMIPREETIKAGKDFGTKVVIGTGPFKFQSWDRGQKATYVRNPDYFRQPMPFFDKIELYLNVQPPQELLKWEAGEVDYAYALPAAETQRIIGDAKYKDSLRVASGSGVNKLMMNFKTKPFDNLKVRQAIAHAIDKNNLAKLQGGTAFPIEGFFARGMLQFDPNFKSKYEYNPDKAMQLLKDAGFGDGIKGVKMWTGAPPSTSDQAIQADLGKIGIQVEFVPGTRKDVGPRMKSGEVALHNHGWSASMWDAYDYVSPWCTAASAADPTSWNDANYSNPKIDELLAQAEKLPLQDDKRIALYHQIEDIIINQDVPWVGLIQGMAIKLSKPYVHHDWPVGIASAWPFTEMAWMSKH
jgi:ABC-type transport system substrate-binding protein